MVKTESLSYKYVRYNQQSDEKEYVEALNNISIDIGKGEFVAVLGRNGSGKSTFAKHINVLLTPSSGKVFVNGHDTSLENNIWLIRQQAGMVFQNPDNQIIATIVEEDVAFGPENLGVNPEEIRERVNASLKAVSMEEFKRKAPNLLSGGQKQRVAIAGVLAMRPDLIVFDEATAMLDPIGRKEVMEIIRRLNKEEGITIIHITHFMEEAAQAERVIVIDNGAVVMDGKPQNIFQNVEGLKAIGLDVPQVTEISNILRKKGISLPEDIITVECMVNALSKFKINSPSLNSENSGGKADRAIAKSENDNYIQIENLTYIYSPDTVFKQTAVDDISFSIGKGEFFGIIGHTGSGKSTLIQHFNALLKPTSGRIIIDDMDINADKSKLKSVRSKVGLVFQYPENQLFETTVFEDVAFGPKNAGLSEEEIKERVIKALALVGLSSEFHNKSPFELSGGQKRRAAIAGVLAMEPEVLVMDEPTAGLDPMGRDEIFENIKYLHEQLGNTIIIVSHSMEDIARLTDRLAVIAEGKLKYLGTPKEVFRHGDELEEIGLSAPQTSYLIKALNARGFSLDEDIYTAAEAAEAIYSSIKMQSVERLALK